MSWHYLQEQAAAFSLADYLAGVQSPPAKSNPTPEPSSSTTRNSETSPASPSGTISAPSTALHSEATSTLSQAASPARTSQPQAKVQASPAPAPASGLKCTESFAKYNPATHSWKTPQCSLLADLDEYSETWPKSGIMLHGVCWELPTAAPLTAETESGFLQFGTPTATMRPRSKRFREGSRLPNPAEVAEMELCKPRHLMPTPTACNAPNAGSNTTGPKSLLDVARTGWNPGETWPTPQASDYKRANDSLQTCLHRANTGRQIGLPETVKIRMLPTPTCQDAKNNGAQSQQQRNTKPLNAIVGGALNPEWVEWLMGWPLGWTDLKHLVTARFRSWLRQHSSYLNKD